MSTKQTGKPISVNGAEIPAAAIAAEAQNHPSDDPGTAWAAASEALAIKALLLTQADRLGISAPEIKDDKGRALTPDDAKIEALLEHEITTPEADEKTCRRYYERNTVQFTSPDLVEASHILFAARRKDKDAFAAAVSNARAAIAELQNHPDRFADLAKTLSDCRSARQGGNLGELGPGQTIEEFETFLFNLEEGQLCPVPVKTRYGAHVLKVGRKITGQTPPFQAVRAKIAVYIEEASWRRAVAQYIGMLASRAELQGVKLAGQDGPVVQ